MAEATVPIPTFHTFCIYSLPSKPSTVQVVNSKISHHFWFLFTLSGKLQYGWVLGLLAGGLKYLRGKNMDAL